MTLSVSSAVRAPDGTLTITGTDFTKTTTTVVIDDAPATFNFVSATEITVDAVADTAVEVVVEKGGLQEIAEISQGDPAMSEPPVDPAPGDVEPQAITPGTWPSPIDGFRQAVAGVALVGLIPTGDEKTPYPTGTPCPAGSRFWLRMGFYKSATPT